MIYYGVQPPDLEEEHPGSSAPEIDVYLGAWDGTPVHARVRVEAPGTVTIVRLVASCPSLYLWPALMPGSVLPAAALVNAFTAMV